MNQLKLFDPCSNDTTRAAKTHTISRVNPQSLPCGNCKSQQRKLGTSKEPHSASLLCGECDHFIKWIGKSELQKIENLGGQQ